MFNNPSVGNAKGIKANIATQNHEFAGAVRATSDLNASDVTLTNTFHLENGTTSAKSTHASVTVQKMVVANTVTANQCTIHRITNATRTEIDTSGLFGGKNIANFFVPTGVVLMWSGKETTIPEGWCFCDGSNGTPDLRDRFIRCANESDILPNTSGNNTSTVDGAHDHSGGTGATTLTSDQLPTHSHTITHTTESVFANANLNSSSTTATGIPPLAGATSTGTVQTQTQAAAANNGHSHDFPMDPGHSHDYVPPYYALCFIMKL
jgi:hypothetical protein